MMMCKCCDDNNAQCACIHHKAKKWIMGFVLIVVGVVSYGYNYHWWGEKLLCAEKYTVWDWLLPGIVVLIGVKMLVMGCMSMMKKSENEGTETETKKE